MRISTNASSSLVKTVGDNSGILGTVIECLYEIPDTFDSVHDGGRGGGGRLEICSASHDFFTSENLGIIAVFTTVADPGFPAGGHGPVLGGVDLRRRRFSVKIYVKTTRRGRVLENLVCKSANEMYAKMKELGPLDPPMYYVMVTISNYVALDTNGRRLPRHKWPMAI